MKHLILIIALLITGCKEYVEEDMTISVPTSLELNTTNVVDSSDNPLLATRKTVACGSFHTVFIDDDGELWGAGLASYGQLGYTPTVQAWTKTIQLYQNNVRSVFAWTNRTMLIKWDGTLWGAGENSDGQLGLGTTTDTYKFVQSLSDVKDIALCHIETYAVKFDGTLWVTDSSGTWTDTGVTDVIRIWGGYAHVIIMKSDGTIWGKGANSYGQLGLGHTTSPVSSFTQISENYVNSVSCGNSHTILLFSDGTTKSAGLNTAGQLGIGNTTSPISTFTATTLTGTITAIDAGGDHTFALKSDNTLWAAGNNYYGSFGDGAGSGLYQSFTDVGQTGVIGVDTHAYTSVIRKSDNKLWSAGLNDNSQLLLNTGITAQVDTYTETDYTNSTHGIDAYTEYEDGEIIQYLNNLFIVKTLGSVRKSAYFSLAYLSPSNPYKPFDTYNNTIATATTQMTYTIKGTSKFDTLALGRVKADSATIVFTLPVSSPNYYLWLDGVEVASGGNGITLSVTRSIDTDRDALGVLEKWHTTEIFYSPIAMDADSTVSITLDIATGETLELGSILLGMSVNAGYSNLSLAHSYKDFSIAEYDTWGNLNYVERQRINTYRGTVDVDITNYDRTVRLMTSLGKQLVIVNGSTSKTIAPDSQSVFSATQMIGRFMSFDSKTKIKDSILDQKAEYSFVLEELA